jgi:hypothetical protein
LIAETSTKDSTDAVGGHYFTNTKQIKYTKERIAEAQALGQVSSAVQGVIDEAEGNVKRAEKRIFIRPKIRRILLILIAIVLAFVVGSWWFWILVLLFLYWQFEQIWPPQYRVNKKALGPRAKTGLQ